MLRLLRAFCGCDDLAVFEHPEFLSNLIEESPVNDPDFTIEQLGDCRFPSPMDCGHFTGDQERLLYHSSYDEIRQSIDAGMEPPALELAGPRERIFFDPTQIACGIVTCGGLCPGINDVIRSIVLSLHHHYGVKRIHGFRYGYEGLVRQYGHSPLSLTPELVNRIGEEAACTGGWTIPDVCGSRGA